MEWNWGDYNRNELKITIGEDVVTFKKGDDISLATGSESYSNLTFYVLEKEEQWVELDYLRNDMEQNYLNICTSLDLYEHVPNFDDSRAGQMFCTGEEIYFVKDWIVLEQGFALDV